MILYMPKTSRNSEVPDATDATVFDVHAACKSELPKPNHNMSHYWSKLTLNYPLRFFLSPTSSA
jgi:hypothetical protein